MKYKVTKKQNVGKKCIVCGVDNKFGLKTDFYELENGEIVAYAKTVEEHQSYPGRVHGGISAALLDETIGRALGVLEPDMWGVTIELQTKYRKPVPLGERIKIVGRITKNGRRAFEGTGEIILENGDVAVTAHGRYMKLPVEKISEGILEEDEWITNERDDDPEEIEI
ncbi:MAG: PaaI family thioesterase [Sarcina sp.]